VICYNQWYITRSLRSICDYLEANSNVVYVPVVVDNIFQGVASTWTWEDALRHIASDERYGALPLKEKKQAFQDYVNEKRRFEKVCIQIIVLCESTYHSI